MLRALNGVGVEVVPSGEGRGRSGEGYARVYNRLNLNSHLVVRE